MRLNSLIRRMFVASIILLPILLSFSAFTLNRAYRQSLEAAERETLLAQLYALLAIADSDEYSLSLPERTANPRFDTPESGLYARVVLRDGHTVWQSNSLLISALTLNTQGIAAVAGIPIFDLIHSKSHTLSVLRFESIWELSGREETFIFEVLQDRAALEKQIQNYQKNIAFWLIGMALLLIFIQLAIVHWGLKPLRAIAVEVNDIEQGKRRALSGHYPKELEPLTESLNTLLKSELAQRERYKNSLSDLAHSLKTPLSVLRTLIVKDSKQDSEKALMDEQIERMSNIVSHQLKRATIQVRPAYQQQSPILVTVQRIGSALSKVYHERQIQFSTNIDQQIACALEADDLMELLGNVLENAFKYCRSMVQVSATQRENGVEIHVEDDGPGIPSSLQAEILQRGARADTSKVGQGLGLAIAVDILSSYNGALTIGQSKAGGANFILTLPL